jgi:ankyrin repeat protein
MAILDSNKYFSDPNVARFVDDIQRGDVNQVRAALTAGQDPNVEGLEGIRPIHFVFSAKTSDVAEVLLAGGADPNKKSPIGNTPLHYAVQRDSVDFTEVLLRYKADPKIPGENGKPALYDALSSPVAEKILPLIVEKGADVNGKWGGYPPLQASMVEQDWTSAVTLLKLGANPNLPTDQGETATQTFCRLLQRMNQRGPNNIEILMVGEILNTKQGLSSDCMQNLARFK